MTVSSDLTLVGEAIDDGVSVSKTITLTDTELNIDHVEVDVQLTHEYIGDLLIEITSPGGTTSTLLNRPMDGSYEGSGSLDFTFDSVQFWGETSTVDLGGGAVNGDWTLTVTDTETGSVGSLDSWSLKLFGDLATDDTNYVFTDDWNALGTDAARNTINDLAGTDTLNFAAMTSAVDVDLNPGSASQVGELPMMISNVSTIEKAIGGDGADTFSGNKNDNTLIGMRGNDVLEGQAGDDDKDDDQDQVTQQERHRRHGDLEQGRVLHHSQHYE